MTKTAATATPMIPFRYRVDFYQTTWEERAGPPDAPPERVPSTAPVALCGAAFSEVSGLEANMEPKVIRQGGAYDGEIQRPGQITYATVVLKRGMTSHDHLWKWFRLAAEGKTSARMKAVLVHLDVEPEEDGGRTVFRQMERFRWVMRNALPTKFKAATYAGTSSEVGIEELHFVHEGLSLEPGEGGA